MNYHTPTRQDLASSDFDRVEVEFFSRPPALEYESESTPLIKMPLETRLAMHATLVLLLLAAVGMVAFVLQAQLFMPAAEPLGDGLVQLPSLPETQPAAAGSTPRSTATPTAPTLGATPAAPVQSSASSARPQPRAWPDAQPVSAHAQSRDGV